MFGSSVLSMARWYAMYIKICFSSHKNVILSMVWTQNVAIEYITISNWLELAFGNMDDALPTYLEIFTSFTAFCISFFFLNRSSCPYNLLDA